MSDWEPVCEPGGSAGGYRAWWQHLTQNLSGNPPAALCGKVIDVERWKRWGLAYPREDLRALVTSGRLCAECCEAAWKVGA